MKKQYALTQVCEVVISREEIQQMIAMNLKESEADPSYDFVTNHPIFIWSEDGSATVRYAQGDVFCREKERFARLKPVPTRAEIDQLVAERIAKAEK